jgi:hypothetical protein
MQAIQWHTTQDQFVISISKNAMDKDSLMEILQWLRLRFLLSNADFEPDIEELGEEILSDWWEKNKSRFIPTEI